MSIIKQESKSISLIDKMIESDIKFYLTGSRLFSPQNITDKTDYDLFVDLREWPKLITFLEEYKSRTILVWAKNPLVNWLASTESPNLPCINPKKPVSLTKICSYGSQDTIFVFRIYKEKIYHYLTGTEDEIYHNNSNWIADIQVVESAEVRSKIQEFMLNMNISFTNKYLNRELWQFAFDCYNLGKKENLIEHN